jgi:two-component system response regulator HydG
MSRLRTIMDTTLPLLSCFRDRYGAEVRGEDVGDGLIGDSVAMRTLTGLIARVAPHFTTVLVTGETGTGKELVARALHARSPRAGRPFVAVNCSAIVETLLESELYGHVRGAFTGATDHRAGLFERAHTGVLLLDEVGELPINAQAKLLRALETGEISRVGGGEPRRVDVRVIAATNRPLDVRVQDGQFRSDLYYRLNIVELHVPPLRDRLDDLPLLAAHFLNDTARRLRPGAPVPALTPEACAALESWHWPGNVRELRHALERAVMLTSGEHIGAADLRLPLRVTGGLPRLARPIAELESEEVRRALAETRGNKQEAARRLGISRRALYRRIEKFGLEAIPHAA